MEAMFDKVYFMLLILGIQGAVTLGVLIAWFINHRGWKDKS